VSRFLLCLLQENPALLGGMIVEIGDYRMDLSAATRQAKLRAHILDGLSA
jgi:F0F1-type ATP synthase delta subunit